MFDLLSLLCFFFLSPPPPSSSAKTTCQPGQYIKAPGSSIENRVCAACPDGKFSSEKNTDECTSHSLPCSRLEYEVKPVSPTSDRVCKALTVCETGKTYATEPATPTSDRVCSPVSPPCSAKGKRRMKKKNEEEERGRKKERKKERRRKERKKH